MALPALQVADALAELLAGFNAANDRTNGRLFAVLSDEAGRKHIYEGLTTVLLRLVFLLYAEDLGLMPVENEVYQRKYAVGGLAAHGTSVVVTALHKNDQNRKRRRDSLSASSWWRLPSASRACMT